jgi:LEA14-like dessication related protein
MIFPVRTLFLGFFLVFFGGFFSCKTVKLPLETAPPPENPRALLSFGKTEARNLEHITLHFNLEAENPRPSPARVEIKKWTLRLNGLEESQGAALTMIDQEAELGALSSAGFPLKLDLTPAALAAFRLEGAGEFEAGLTLDVLFTYPGGAPVEVRVEGTAVFPRIRAPVFTIAAIAILKAELINTRFRVNLRIDNPNYFPVDLSSFSYELFEGGRFWAGGRETDVLHIPAGESAETRLFLVMNFINMKRELLDKIITLKQVRYRFTGEAEVSTGVDYLPEFRTSFDLSGLSEVVD